MGMAHSLSGIKILANVKKYVICFTETGCLFMFGKPVSRTRLGPSQMIASTETQTDGGVWGLLLGMKCGVGFRVGCGETPPMEPRGDNSA